MTAMATNRGSLDDAVVVLYREHYDSLVRLASLLVDDVGSAEEVVQDAFVAFARGKRPDDPTKSAAYLRSATLNGARSVLRKRGVRRRHLRSVGPVPTAPGADVAVQSAAESAQMLAALRELPERQRDVLILRYYTGLSEAEIAEALGIAAGSVKSHAHRGLRRLEKLLEAQ